MRIGIFFGGNSREREVSFAGGRTVYDNLDKSLFEAIPIFVDSFGGFILLNWQQIYKGSIRDFYPPTQNIPDSEFQIYAESLGDLNILEQEELISSIGKRISPDALKKHIDMAFLALHGANGEDGSIQGMLEYLGIPYTGSDIFSSAFGINKVIQKQLMSAAGFNVPKFEVIYKKEINKTSMSMLFDRCKAKVGNSMVLKAATQGSSIGISFLKNPNLEEFTKGLKAALFIEEIDPVAWKKLSNWDQKNYIVRLADFRTGPGLPILVNDQIIHHPEELLKTINHLSERNEDINLEAFHGENAVVIEPVIEGREFSCIVVRNLDGNPLALPPTEIKKSGSVFDYRSKYLPGMSRKITPIDLPDKEIQKIREACEKLYQGFGFKVYARIDGFYTSNGEIILNDPNTTSGMLPSSFFFHQAAEIGLNPTQFLTYIIHSSLLERKNYGNNSRKAEALLINLELLMRRENKQASQKEKVAIIFGGYSTERHISVESGRNIYEKLASSKNYEPIPIFLTGDNQDHTLYRIPINIMLKDNADDIAEKIKNYKVHSAQKRISEEASEITKLFGDSKNLAAPTEISYNEIKEQFSSVFIALHGRPGEDGQVQKELEQRRIPFNGSREGAAKITINKYETNELLKSKGFNIPNHALVYKSEWIPNPKRCMEELLKNFSFPFIAKPADDGCSSAVKKIKNEEEWMSFSALMFREEEEKDPKHAAVLQLKMNEEFPQKDYYVIEELIGKKDAEHFLEITGGLLTSYSDVAEIEYEIFEPSETLAGGEVLSLEEKFLAGEGQNITPARFSSNSKKNKSISNKVRKELEKISRTLQIEGYARIDAFVRIWKDEKVELIVIEINSLPGMTPATCIFHQTAINGYRPYDFIERILHFGTERNNKL